MVMTPDEFKRIISEDPALEGPLRNAASTVPQTTMKFDASGGVIALLIFLPAVTFIVNDIGLPWLHEAKRYSELWRQKLDGWIDEQYRKQGLDPEIAKTTTEALRRELEAITDKNTRKVWEGLAELFKGEETGDA
jgi:hypothetical protein